MRGSAGSDGGSRVLLGMPWILWSIVVGQMDIHAHPEVSNYEFFACKRLSDKEHYGNITIQAVYEEVGYTNAASFIRAFKKEMGMNPSVYQKLEEDGRAGRGAAMGEEAE